MVEGERMTKPLKFELAANGVGLAGFFRKSKSDPTLSQKLKK
jgi:hypothetical protein